MQQLAAMIETRAHVNSLMLSEVCAHWTGLIQYAQIHHGQISAFRSTKPPTTTRMSVINTLQGNIP